MELVEFIYFVFGSPKHSHLYDICSSLQDECLAGRETETVPEEEEIDDEKSDGEIRKITEKINSLTVSNLDDPTIDKRDDTKMLQDPINDKEKNENLPKNIEEKQSDLPNSPNTLSSRTTSGLVPKSPKSPRSPLSPRYVKVFPKTGTSDIEVGNYNAFLATLCIAI